MPPLFERRAGYEAEIYAEAQALLDDGLDRAFVLELFPGEEEWLAPLLTATATLEDTYAAEAPSYYFEASLKNQVLAAARRHPRAAPSPSFGAVRTAFASAAVLTAAGAMGIATLGFVTSDTAVPGDWNYSFKVGRERVEYALARGNGRVDQQLDRTEARVFEIQRLNSRGDLSAADIDRLKHEAQELADLARQRQLDELQQARLRSLSELSITVLQDAKTKQPALEPAVTNTQKTVADAVAAGLGTTTTLPTPAGSPTPATAPSPSPTAEATPAAPGATATPAASPSPLSTASAAPTQSLNESTPAPAPAPASPTPAP